MDCLGLVIILGKPFRVSQDMRPADLLGTTGFFSKNVIGWKPVMHDDLASLVLQDRFDDLIASAAMYFVPRDFIVNHAPDPVADTVKPPSRLVASFDRCIADFLLDLCIMRSEGPS